VFLPAPTYGYAGPVKQTARVGIVDDHPSIVNAVSAAIASTEDLAVASTGRTLADAIEMIGRVDVLVCDVQLEGHAEGLRLLDLVRDERTSGTDPAAVLLLSGFGHGSLVRTAIERGAAGYLNKGVEVEAIVEAIRTIAGGGTVFRAADLDASKSAPRRPSEREIEVIAGIVGGATNAELGGALGISEKTIESHLHRLFDRYGVLSRTELAILAVNEGWLVESPRGAT
jgi:DNA-binding NarL/FixJ family response regulator